MPMHSENVNSMIVKRIAKNEAAMRLLISPMKGTLRHHATGRYERQRAKLLETGLTPEALYLRKAARRQFTLHRRCANASQVEIPVDDKDEFDPYREFRKLKLMGKERSCVRRDLFKENYLRRMGKHEGDEPDEMSDEQDEGLGDGVEPDGHEAGPASPHVQGG